jgi:hypothetical protein
MSTTLLYHGPSKWGRAGVKAADKGFGCDACMIGPILAPKPAQHPGPDGVWFCTLTTRNGLDISASQWNTSPIHGKVGIAVGLKSLSVLSHRRRPSAIRPGEKCGPERRRSEAPSPDW